MTPTWLEIAVAALLLWVAWQVGVILAPRLVRRFRGRFSAPSAPARKPPALTDRE